MKRQFKRALSMFLAVLIAVPMIMFTPLSEYLATTAEAVVDTSSGTTKLKVNADGSFKILQIADFQDGFKSDGSVNAEYRSINTIKLAIARENPDLIVLTGDNIAPDDTSDRIQTMTDFRYSVEKLTECFGDIPFVVTFGNHDVERNTSDGTTVISLKEQVEVYEEYGALPLINNISVTDTSDNATAKYGTGYVNVYDSTGTTVVERVILINSGTYEGSRADNHFGRVGVNATDYVEYDYDEAVSAISGWTSDSAIKCIAFQHIPLQEMLYGTTSVLTVDSSTGYKPYPTATTSFSADSYYVKNTSNSTVTGEFHERIGQSYGSTIDLFNALAKDNVAGIFFGHDHTNTVTGTATINGKSLKMGYGGGLDIYPTSYNADSDYADYNPYASLYTLKTDGTLTKDVLRYYKLLRDYDISEYSSSQTYISDVRLFAADTLGAKDGNAGYYSEAVDKCEAAGYTVLTDLYTNNTSADGTDLIPTVADFNFDCYCYDGATGAKAVVLGYKTTTDPSEAITDIRIYDGGTTPPSTWVKQECYSDDTNNSKNITLNQTYDTTNNNSITYYNANYDFSGSTPTLRTDTKAQIKFNEGLDQNNNYNGWLFYTKDSRAGLPIKSLFVNITDTYKVGGSFKPYNAINDNITLTMCTKSKLNQYTSEYPYTFAQLLDDSYDYDRDNYAANAKLGNTSKLNNVDSHTSCWAFIGLVRAMPTDFDISETETTTSCKIAVPETIYLQPEEYATGDTVFQYYVNNNITVEDGVATVTYATESAQQTGNIYFYCPNATDVTVSLDSCSSKEISSLTQSGSLWSGTITAGTLSNGVTAGNSKNIKWTFTYSYSGTSYTQYAYSTVYAPYLTSVATVSYSNNNGCGDQVIGWWQGVHDVGNIPDTTSPGNTFGTSDGNKAVSFYCGKRKDSSVVASAPELTATSNSVYYFCPMLGEIGEETSENRYAKYWFTTTAADGFVQAVRWGNKNFSGSNAKYRITCVTGYTALITVDSSRYSNINQIPNLKFGFMCPDYTSSDNDENKGYRIGVTTANYDGWESDDDLNYSLWSMAGKDRDGNQLGNYVASGKSARGKLFHNTISNWDDGNDFSFSVCALNSQRSSNGVYTTAAVFCPITVTTVDKGALRTAVQNAVNNYQEENYTTDTWSEFQTALTAAALKLGNPTATQVDAAEALETAEKGLVKKTSAVTYNIVSSTGTVLSTKTENVEYGKNITVSATEKTGYTFNNISTSITLIDDEGTYSYDNSAETTNYKDFKQYTLNGNESNCGGFNEGDTFMLECDAKCTGTFSNFFYTGRKVASIVNSAGVTSNGSDGNNTITVASDYKHYTAIFTLKSDVDGSVDSKKLLFRAQKGCNASVKNIVFKKIITTASKETTISNITSSEITIDVNYTANSYRLYFDNIYEFAGFDNATNDLTAKTVSVTHTGTNAETTRNSTGYIDVEPDTRYIISADWTLENCYSQLYCWYYTNNSGTACSPAHTDGTSTISNVDGNVGASGTPQFKTGGHHYYVITTPSDCEYMSFRLDCDRNGDSWSGDTHSVTLSDIHIIKDTLVREGIDYGLSDALCNVENISTVLTNATPTREGYTFDGWYTGENGSGTKITADNFLYQTSDGTHLYSNWIPAKNTVAYNNIFDFDKWVTAYTGHSMWAGKGQIDYDMANDRIAITINKGESYSNKSFINGNKNYYGQAGGNDIALVKGHTYRLSVDIQNPTATSWYAMVRVSTGQNPTENESEETGVTFGGSNVSSTTGTNSTDEENLVVDAYKKSTFEVYFTVNADNVIPLLRFGLRPTITSGTTTTQGELIFSNIKIVDVTAPTSYADSALRTPADSYVTCGSDVTLATTGITNFSGYNFGGWYPAVTASTNQGSGTAVTSVTTSTDYSTNKHVYAKWNKKDYGISYNLGGGSDASEGKTTYTVEDNVNLGSSTLTGYTFTGWTVALTTSGTGSLTSGSYNINKGSWGAVTATATWSKDEYTITYNLNDGTNDDTNPSVYYVDSETFTLAEPTRTGYTFTGWTGSNGTTASKSVTVTKGSTGNLTYTANWTANDITISYAGMDGATYGTNHPGTFKYNATASISDPTKAGYTFTGWTVTSTGATTLNSQKNLTLAANTYANTVTLTATWTANTYTATFVANGGKWSDSSTANKTAQYGLESSLTAPAVSRTGYSFSKWKIEYKYSDISWNDGFINYNTGAFGSDTMYSNSKYANPIYLKSGLTYNLTVTGAIYNNLRWRLFNTDGTYIGSETAASYTPTKDCYVYILDYDNLGDTVRNSIVISTTSTSVIANGLEKVTYTAQWTADTYSYGFANGGTAYSGASLPSNGNYTIEDNIALGAATLTGYTFTKWTVASTVGNWTAGNEATNVNGKWGNVTFNANWNAIDYSITYANAAADNGETVGTMPDDTTYTIASGATLTSPASVTGYTFNGWDLTVANHEGESSSEIKNNSNTKQSSITAGSYGDITATASWTAKTTNVTLDKNGGTTAGTTSVTATYDCAMPTDGVTAPQRKYIVTYNYHGATGSNSTTSGTATYTFGGYYTGSDGTGTQYYTGAMASNHKWDITAATKTLYAKWSGGTLTLPTPTKTGYTFKGWYTAETGGTQVTNSTAFTSEQTIHAQWTANTVKVVLKLDNAEWATKQTVTLNGVNLAPSFDSTTGTYTFTTTSSVNLVEGTSYRIYVNGSDTGIDATTASEGTVEYFTVKVNGTNASFTEAQYLKGSNVTVTPTVTTGYHITKWDGATDASTSKTITSISSAKTYTVVAEANSYTISYAMNSGNKGKNAPTSGTYNTAFEVSAPTRDGYTFAGWTVADYTSTTAKWGTSSSSQGNSVSSSACANGAEGSVYFKNLTTTNGGTVTLTANWTDSAKPTVSLSSTNSVATSQTVTLTMSDNKGVVKYYWGTSSSPADSDYSAITSTTSTSIYKTVTAANTYYLIAKDAAGNTSTAASITFYKTTLSSAKGAVTPASVITMSGDSFEIPTPANHTAYDFGGWYTNSGCTSAVTLTSGKYAPSSSTTLYAKWTPTSYKVTYNMNLADGTKSTVDTPDATEYNIESANTVVVATPATRNGYTFTGWKVASAVGNWSAGASVSAGDALTGKYGDVTLTAQWDKLSYDVTYSQNSTITGATLPDNVTGAFDVETAYTLDVTTAVLTGYTFTGWNLATTGDFATGTVTSKNTTGAINAGSYGNVTATATWSINSSKLNVDPNGGTWNGNTTTQTYTQNYNTTKSIPVPTRTGYTFTVWTSTYDNTKATAFNGSGISSTNTTDTQTYKFGAVNGAVDTITAGWSANKYTVTYAGNGATGGSTESSTHYYDTAKNLTANGYTRAYTVTFYNNYNSTDTSTYGTDTAAYTFGGWTFNNTSYTNSQSVKNLTASKNGSVTMTAVWNGGKLSSLATPERTGYTFDGWYTERSGGTEVDATKVYTANTSLYAHWTPTVYTITLNGNGQTTAATTTTIYEKYATGYYKESGCTNALSTTAANSVLVPAKTDYKFEGYYTSSDNGTTLDSTQYIDATGKILSANTAFTGNTTLYAKWTLNSYNVSALAYSNSAATVTTVNGYTQVTTGGTVSVSNSKVQSGGSITFTAEANEGYAFDGWYTDTSLTDKESASASYTKTNIKSTVTLYAKFSIQSYTLTLTANAGTTLSANVSNGAEVYYGQTVTLTKGLTDGYKALVVTKAGATFDGTSFNMPASNTTIVASATPIGYSISYDKNGGTGTMSNTSATYDVDATLSANGFTAPSYKVTYNANGGNCTTTSVTQSDSFSKWTINSTDYSAGATVKNLTKTDGATVTAKAKWTHNTVTLPTATRTGYTFGGWLDGSKTYSADTSYTVSKTVTLTAQWNAKTSALTFNINNGTGTVPTGLTATYDSAMPDGAIVPKRDGYTFLGWFDSTGVKYYNADATSARNWDKDTTTGTTLTAQWAQINTSAGESYAISAGLQVDKKLPGILDESTGVSTVTETVGGVTVKTEYTYFAATKTATTGVTATAPIAETDVTVLKSSTDQTLGGKYGKLTITSKGELQYQRTTMEFTENEPDDTFYIYTEIKTTVGDNEPVTSYVTNAVNFSIDDELYFEDSFIENTNGITSGIKYVNGDWTTDGTQNETSQTAGETPYTTSMGYSGGQTRKITVSKDEPNTAPVKSKTLSDTASWKGIKYIEFTVTGTGYEVIGNMTAATGAFRVFTYNASTGSRISLYTVENYNGGKYMNLAYNTETKATSGYTDSVSGENNYALYDYVPVDGEGSMTNSELASYTKSIYPYTDTVTSDITALAEGSVVEKTVNGKQVKVFKTSAATDTYYMYYVNKTDEPTADKVEIKIIKNDARRYYMYVVSGNVGTDFTLAKGWVLNDGSNTDVYAYQSTLYQAKFDNYGTYTVRIVPQYIEYMNMNRYTANGGNDNDYDIYFDGVVVYDPVKEIEGLQRFNLRNLLVEQEKLTADDTNGVSVLYGTTVTNKEKNRSIHQYCTSEEIILPCKESDNAYSVTFKLPTLTALDGKTPDIKLGVRASESVACDVIIKIGDDITLETSITAVKEQYISLSELLTSNGKTLADCYGKVITITNDSTTKAIAVSNVKFVNFSTEIKATSKAGATPQVSTSVCNTAANMLGANLGDDSETQTDKRVGDVELENYTGPAKEEKNETVTEEITDNGEAENETGKTEETTNTGNADGTKTETGTNATENTSNASDSTAFDGIIRLLETIKRVLRTMGVNV